MHEMTLAAELIRDPIDAQAAILVPMDGLELSTFALRMRCSTN